MEANLPHVTRRGLSPLRAMNLDYPSRSRTWTNWRWLGAGRSRLASSVGATSESTGFLAAFHAQPGAVKGETNE